jgi:hypothetical protein
MKTLIAIAVALMLVSCAGRTTPYVASPFVDNDQACAKKHERGSAGYNFCRWMRGA